MAKAKAKKTEIVRGFKGFDKDLQCRGMQYEVGKTHKHKGPVTLCGRGFHFCEYPLDVLYFYPPADSRYAEVSGEGVSTEKNDGTKRVCQRLMVNAEIGIPGLVKAAVQYVLDNVTTERVESNTGDWSAATNTGHWSGRHEYGPLVSRHEYGPLVSRHEYGRPVSRRSTWSGVCGHGHRVWQQGARCARVRHLLC